MSRPFILPTVIENTHRGEREYTIYSRLLVDRIVFLGTEVNDDVANSIIAQLLFLESQDPERDVHLYINSPGGSVTAGLAIYDTMQYIRPDVATICVGQAASMGAFLLAAGAKGKRRALPHARLMIHQPSAGVGYSQVTDIEIRANEFQRMKKVLNERMAFHTGQPVEKLASDVERDYFLTALEGKDYGLIDEVIVRKEEEPEDDK